MTYTIWPRGVKCPFRTTATFGGVCHLTQTPDDGRAEGRAPCGEVWSVGGGAPTRTEFVLRGLRCEPKGCPGGNRHHEKQAVVLEGGRYLVHVVIAGHQTRGGSGSTIGGLRRADGTSSFGCRRRRGLLWGGRLVRRRRGLVDGFCGQWCVLMGAASWGYSRQVVSRAWGGRHKVQRVQWHLTRAGVQLSL